MRIALLGDIGLFGINTVKDDSYKIRFSSIKKILDECDYVVGNLETPLTSYNRTIGGKSAYLKGTPEDVEILKYLGVTHVSLANNHMYDYTESGLNDTIRSLESAGIAWFGVDGKQCALKKQKSRVKLLGFCCYSTNAVGLERSTLSINALNPIEMNLQIEECINNGELPIISCHWGEEHVHYPNWDHVRIARKLCKGREVVVYGHHPHVIQGVEKIDNSWISYSLGNFCFDDVYTSKSNEPLIKLSKDNQESFIWIIDVMGNHIVNQDRITFSFYNQAYEIDPKIESKMTLWSEALLDEESMYKRRRSTDLNAYLDNRKRKRNFQWYIKRLNFESVKMIIRARRNRKRYLELINK